MGREFFMVLTRKDVMVIRVEAANLVEAMERARDGKARGTTRDTDIVSAAITDTVALKVFPHRGMRGSESE